MPTEGVGARPWEERGLSEPGLPLGHPHGPPCLAPCPSRRWALQLAVLLMAPVWSRSLRMLRGKGTQPASRPRAPQRPPRRTGPTCTSCRSPRSPCPWPSSPGVQVCESPGGPGGGWRVWLRAQQPVLPGKEGEGLLCALFCWDLGCCEQAWGQPSASTSPPWAAVQKGGDGHRGSVAPSGPGVGHLCAGRRGSSAVLGMPEPRPPCGTSWPLRDVAPLCPVGRAHPLGDEGLFGAPSVGGL